MADLCRRDVEVIAVQPELLEFAFSLAASTPRSISAPMNMSPLMPLKISR